MWDIKLCGTLGRKLVDGEDKVKIFGEEFTVLARIEYIEGFSGHADQEWLLNFIYSFYEKPKHIFLVHGEPEGQVVLKQKIFEDTNIAVIIPGFGETYALDGENVKIEGIIETPAKYRPIRLELIERLSTLKEEIEDMNVLIKTEVLNSEKAKDEDIVSINNKIKEIEKLIVQTIEIGETNGKQVF